ncbi:hypothetical protein LTR67_006269 [Exophiala xenobiotica]
MSKSTISSDPQNKAAENGIANTSGALIAAFAPLYLAGVPLTSYLTSPNGILERTVHTLLDVTIPGGTIPHDRLIPAISALYVFFTFGATGAFSAAGQAMARPTGLDNSNPREHLHQLRGLPNRLRSAHYNLLENFSGFALAAGLTQTLAPTNAQLINLLGLHALVKMLVYYPAYLLDVPPPRTLAHVLATSALINVLWRLALGAK